MTEYCDYPPGVHIDSSFGAEYDPYPDNRTRQGPNRTMTSPSWILTGNLQPPAASTPMVTPTNVASPIPTVHRLTQNDDPTRTSIPFGSPMSHHGMIPTRPVDPATMPWLTRSPTNVSYPATTRQTWTTAGGQAPPMRMNDNGSLFQPLQASTPAPSRYGDPRIHPDQPPPPRYVQSYAQPRQQYGVAAEPDEDSHGSTIEREHEYFQQQERYAQSPPVEVDEYELEDHMRPDSASISEGEVDEELIPIDAVVDVGQENMPGMMPEPMIVQPLQTNKGKKRFVGGFWSGLKNFTGFGHKPSLAPLTVAPAQRTIPQANPSKVEIRPPSDTPQHPPSSRLLLSHDEPSHSTDPTPESHGPPTPDPLEPSENPITIPDQFDDTHLPNPHDSTLLTVPGPPLIPQEVELRPTADYDAMSDPIEEELPETTLSSHINRVGKFITDLVHLPWISPTSISEAYSPAESRRARYTGPKPGTSWYSKENHEKLDLLATPTQTSRRQPPLASSNGASRPRLQTRASEQLQSRRPGAYTRHRTREALSAAGSLDDPRMERPRHDPRLTISSLSPTTSPRVGVMGAPAQAVPSPPQNNYYYASPQPLYIYPSPLGSPHAQRAPGRRGSGSGSGLEGVPMPMPMPVPMPMPFQMPNMNVGTAAAGQQPVVYMIAPAPIVVPSSQSPSRQHTHTRRGSKKREVSQSKERERGRESAASPPPGRRGSNGNGNGKRRGSSGNLKAGGSAPVVGAPPLS